MRGDAAPTSANAANLHEGFLAGLEDIYGGTRIARQELEGELLAGEGALWTAQMLARARELWTERPAAVEFSKFERVGGGRRSAGGLGRGVRDRGGRAYRQDGRGAGGCVRRGRIADGGR